MVELVTGYLEMALPPDEVALFEQHVNFCDGCDRYLHQMRNMIEAAGQIREEDLTDETKQRLMSAFRDWSRS